MALRFSPPRSRTATDPLPVFRSQYAPLTGELPVPHGRHTPRSQAPTVQLPAIGRCKTERNLPQPFGGDEVR